MRTVAPAIISFLIVAASAPAEAFLKAHTTRRMSMMASRNHEASSTTASRGSYLKNALLLGGGLLTAVTPSAILPKNALALPASDAPDLNPILLTLDGKPVTFGSTLGKKGTVLVNVASYCALTGGNYPGLVDLYEKYHDKGLEIIGVGCNQFGGQEPESMVKVRKDMKERFGVTFRLFDKVDVNGPGAHPLYAALKKYEPELSGYPPKISWNFEKFLIGPDGVPLRRYRPGVDPEEMEKDIVSLIEKGTLPAARKKSLNDF